MMLSLVPRRAFGLLVLGCLALFAVVSCGGEVAPEPEVPGAMKSGTRLKLVYWESDDGFRAAQNGLFDTELNETCVPSVVGEGYRCVPPMAEWWTRVFGDSACVSPLLRTMGSTPPRYHLEGSRPIERGGVCESGEARLYSVNERSAKTTYFAWEGGVCVERKLDKEESLYALREGSVSWLAEVRLLEEPTSARLRRRTWAGEDGMRMPAFPLDNAYGSQCYLDGQICVPLDDVSAHVRYQDALCTRRVVATFSRCGKPKVIRVETGLCKTESYTVGEAVTEEAPWSWTGSACREDSPTSPGRRERLFAIGKRILPELPVLNRVSDASARSRLREDALVDETGRSFRPYSSTFTDRFGGFECTMSPWSPGISACLPVGPRVEHRYFSDMYCKESLDVHRVYSDPCSEVPKAAYEVPEVGTPNSEAQIATRPIGAPFDGPIYMGPDCLSANRSGEKFRVLEPEVARVPVAFVKQVVDR
jgi:hypothetical protein